MFQNLPKNKMNNKCNLQELNLWMNQTWMQNKAEKSMNNIRMQVIQLCRKTQLHYQPLIK
jgi:hypothetical protein